MKYTLPLILFALIVALLWRGLFLHPAQVPSPLINHAAPDFELPELLSTHPLSNKDFKGHVTLFNVWASWCVACADEHEVLMHIAKNKSFALYGLNYKDEMTDAKKWLLDKGNPYQKIVFDRTGLAAIDWGVYGTPETFVVDKKHIVRYKHIGPITSDDWKNIFVPLIAKLQGEA